jgi:thiol peroxidase
MHGNAWYVMADINFSGRQTVAGSYATDNKLYCSIIQESIMAQITFKGNPVETVGELPTFGMQAPAFKLTKTDLTDVGPQDFAHKNVILNIFPSLDTPVCAASVHRFNKEAGESPDTVVLCISADLPFAHQRFCETEGLNNVIPLSVFRSPEFGKDYGVTIANSPLAGLLSRAIVLLDKSGRVAYTEQVGEIAQEPDYDAALAALAELNS